MWRTSRRIAVDKQPVSLPWWCEVETSHASFVRLPDNSRHTRPAPSPQRSNAQAFCHAREDQSQQSIKSETTLHAIVAINRPAHHRRDTCSSGRFYPDLILKPWSDQRHLSARCFRLYAAAVAQRARDRYCFSCNDVGPEVAAPLSIQMLARLSKTRANSIAGGYSCLYNSVTGMFWNPNYQATLYNPNLTMNCICRHHGASASSTGSARCRAVRTLNGLTASTCRHPSCPRTTIPNYAWWPSSTGREPRVPQAPADLEFVIGNRLGCR